MPSASSSRAQARTLTVQLDEHTVTLAAEALRGEADRRRRAAVTFSGELAEKRRNGDDIRTGALQVVNTLAEADSLGDAAERLAGAWEAGKPARAGKRRPSTPDASAPPGGDTSLDDRIATAEHELDEEHDDEDDVEVEPGDGTAAEHLPDGSTVVDHDDDPDVAAARAALAGPTAPTPPDPGTSTPPAVAPAAPTLPGQ